MFTYMGGYGNFVFYLPRFALIKAKLKTAKKKEKALKDAEKDNPKPESEVKPKEKSNKDNPKT